MTRRDEYIDHLKSVPLFSSLGRKDVTAIARAADEIDFAAGTTLITEGESGSEAFIVLTGSVEVRRGGRAIASLGSGDIIGELSLLDQSPRTASVVCTTDCTVLVIDRRHFAPLIETSPPLGLEFLRELASRLRELDRTVFG